MTSPSVSALVLPFRSPVGLAQYATDLATQGCIWKRRGTNQPSKMDFTRRDRGVPFPWLTNLFTPRYMLTTIQIKSPDAKLIRQFIGAMSYIIQKYDVDPIYSAVLEENKHVWLEAVPDEPFDLMPEDAVLLVELLRPLDIFKPDKAPEPAKILAEGILELIHRHLDKETVADLYAFARCKLDNRQMYIHVVQRLYCLKKKNLPAKDPIADTDAFQDFLDERDSIVLRLREFRDWCDTEICGAATLLFTCADQLDRLYGWLSQHGYRKLQHTDRESSIWSRLNPEAEEFLPQGQ